MEPEARAVLGLVIARGMDVPALAAATRLPEADVRARLVGAVVSLGLGALDEDATLYLLGLRPGDPPRSLPVRRAAQVAEALQAEWPEYRAPGLPPARAGLLVWSVCGAVVAAAVLGILLVAGVFDSSSDPAATGSVPKPVAPVRIVMLAPGGGSSSGGDVTIGLDAKYAPYMTVAFTALPAPPRGEVQLLWIDNGNGRGFPLPTPLQTPTGGGSFRQRYALSPALAPLLSLAKYIDVVSVSASRLARLSAQIEASGRAGAGTSASDLPQRPGTIVLRGAVPKG